MVYVQTDGFCPESSICLNHDRFSDSPLVCSPSHSEMFGTVAIEQAQSRITAAGTVLDFHKIPFFIRCYTKSKFETKLVFFYWQRLFEDIFLTNPSSLLVLAKHQE